MRKNKRLFFASCLLLFVVFIGCGKKDTFTEKDDENIPKEVVVSTQYGDLFYQEKWAEHMKIEETMDGDTLTVSFYTELNEVKYLLFQLVIGGDQAGAFGKLTDTDGTKRDVHVMMPELVVAEELSDEEKDHLFAIQEEVNYVIDHLK